MLFFCSLTIFFYCCCPPCKMSHPACSLPFLTSKNYFKDGDIILGGIFPLRTEQVSTDITFQRPPAGQSCDTFRFSQYARSQGMLLAIQEINKTPDLLPNITLGLDIYDSCASVTGAVQSTFRLLSGKENAIPNYQYKSSTPLAAVLGDAASRNSIPIARILGLQQYPQISYGSTVSTLSDKHQFPSFLRTVPNDNAQATGMAHMIAYFNWTWIGIIGEESDYGQQGSQNVKEQLLKLDICVAFFESIPLIYSETKINRIINIIRRSTANVIVLFADEVPGYNLIKDMTVQNITKKVWIMSDAAYYLAASDKVTFRTIRGCFSFDYAAFREPEFRKKLVSISPLQPSALSFLSYSWANAFGCTWLNQMQNSSETNRNQTSTQICTGLENLNDKNFDESDSGPSTVYNTVYVVAYAIHNIYSCKAKLGPFSNGSCPDFGHLQPWQILHYIRTVHFKSQAGNEFFFDANGDPPAVCDIISLFVTEDGTFEKQRIGRFDSLKPLGSDIIINISAITWNSDSPKIPVSVCSENCPVGHRKASMTGQPICCFTCIPCAEGEIANQTDSTECLKCPDKDWSNEKQDHCIPKAIEFLSYEDSLGATLTSMSAFSASASVSVLIIFYKHNDTPIVRANNQTLSYLLLMSLMVCSLCSLVFIGQPNKINCLLCQTIFGISFVLSVSCILAKTIMVVIAFRSTKPNSKLTKYVGPVMPNTTVFILTFFQLILSSLWLAISPPFPEENMKSQMGKIILECNEGSVTAFWCMLGYLGLLAFVSFIVAFLSRNLPDSFNEARYISFSMLVFVSVWLSFIPAYLSTEGKYMVAVEIFAILSSSMGVLLCIFAPKCYVIVFHPEMNTKQYIMGKQSSQGR